MVPSLFLLVAFVAAVKGDITGKTLVNGACLCFNGNSVNVNVRSTACGQSVIGSAKSGQCFRYMGSNTRCSSSLNNVIYIYWFEFFQINYNGNKGWTDGLYLDLESDFRCYSQQLLWNDLAEAIPTKNEEEYTCQLTDQGKRVHESSSHTPYDCVDSRCQNTCKGGQCVAYVKCRCTKNGKYPPATGAWRPGQRLKTADGKCNRNIAPNTAIATFTSGDRYYGHAAVFIKCVDDDTVQVYDQWCGRSVDYSTYPRSHRFFSGFATIRSVTDGPSSFSCRSETSGPTHCPASVPGCKSGLLGPSL